MEQVTSDGFIKIDAEQVAMPEETVCKLLGVSSERLSELARTVNMMHQKGGIYIRDGKHYFSSPEVIFKIRDANGKKSADLSSVGLYSLFEQAEERLLARDVVKAKRKRVYLKAGIFLLVILGAFGYGLTRDAPPKPASTPPPAKTEHERPPLPKVEYPEESFYAESYDAIAEKTKMRVTESWLLEFGERVTPDGNVATQGYVELNSDGVKRPFWLIFDGATRQVLRVKIGPDVIYTAIGR